MHFPIQILHFEDASFSCNQNENIFKQFKILILFPVYLIPNLTSCTYNTFSCTLFNAYTCSSYFYPLLGVAVVQRMTLDNRSHRFNPPPRLLWSFRGDSPPRSRLRMTDYNVGLFLHRFQQSLNRSAVLHSAIVPKVQAQQHQTVILQPIQQNTISGLKHDGTAHVYILHLTLRALL